MENELKPVSKEELLALLIELHDSQDDIDEEDYDEEEEEDITGADA